MSKERFTERRQLALERAPARPHADVDVLPVVEPRALYLTLVQREAKRLDEMQCGARCQTAAPGVAGVPVDLRMHQHDVRAHETSGADRA